MGNLARPEQRFHFFRGRREINPLAVVFRPFRRTQTFRGSGPRFATRRTDGPRFIRPRAALPLQTAEHRFFESFGVSRCNVSDRA